MVKLGDWALSSTDTATQWLRKSILQKKFPKYADTSTRVLSVAKGARDNRRRSRFSGMQEERLVVTNRRRGYHYEPVPEHGTVEEFLPQLNKEVPLSVPVWRKALEWGITYTSPPLVFVSGARKAWERYRPRSYDDRKRQIEQDADLQKRQREADADQAEYERTQGLAEAEYKKRVEELKKEKDYMDFSLLEAVTQGHEREMTLAWQQQKQLKDQLASYEAYVKELERLEAEGYDVGEAGVTAEQYLSGEYPKPQLPISGGGIFELPKVGTSDWLGGATKLSMVIVGGLVIWGMTKKS